jgi:glyoxylase-like metal-dependent hydrolase (beta-lactamase superfamily II)
MATEATTALTDRTAPAHAENLAFDFRLGDIDFVTLSDGFIDTPASLLAPEIPAGALNTFLTDCGQPGDFARTPINCLLVRNFPGVGNVLIDAGMGILSGHSPKPILTVNRLSDALVAAGISRQSVNVVLVSHIHPDHIGGLFDKDDSPLFPNATYFVTREEVDFWGAASPNLSGTFLPPPAAINVVKSAQRFIRLAGQRLRQFRAGDAPIPTVETILLAGHTPGQVGFLFRSLGETLLYTADAAGHPFISLQHPEWRFSFDTDAPLAIQTRRSLIQRLLDEGWHTFTPHFPWPCVGVVREENGVAVWRAGVRGGSVASSKHA